jgi:DNA-binding beta-propeller fold protein YncE
LPTLNRRSKLQRRTEVSGYLPLPLVKRGLAIAFAAAALAAMATPRTAQAWTDFCCLPWATPSQVAITPDGRYAYGADRDTVLAFARNVETGELGVIDSYRVHGGRTAELSPDGRTLYVAAALSGTVAEFRRDETTGALTPIGEYDSGRPGSHQGRYRDIAFTADGRTAYLTYDDILETATRDPDTGLLAYAGEMHASSPRALELSADGRFLYVGQKGSDPLLVFARDGDGSLTQIQQVAASARDLALTPDGKRLYLGPDGPTTFERDPETGVLTLVGPASTGSEGDIGDGQILPTPDGAGLYIIAPEHGIYQYEATAGGLGFVKTYRENADGQGLRKASSLSSSPDGGFVYVGSDQDGERPGRLAAFRREQGTNRLAFASIYVGPVFNGHAPWETTNPSVTINGGNEYTNDPDVTLTVSGIQFPAQFVFEVSNDGGFSPESSEWIQTTKAAAMTFGWTLATSGPERLPKTVYVRSRITGDDFQVTSDDIVLDQRPPEIVSAAQSGRTLRIRARDGLSGLKQMQVTRDRGKPGRWRAFQSRLTVAKSKRRVYVRVRDAAGNRSHWVAARRKR